MLSYRKIRAGRQVDLAEYLGPNNLRKKIGFAAIDMPEELHYEQSFEFLIPQDSPIRVRIFPDSWHVSDKGASDNEGLSRFDEVVVEVGEMLVIWPERCHRVVEKGRFVALKVEGKHKVFAKPDQGAPGCCKNTDCSLWTYCEKIGIEGRR
jgi:hypothetical protein